MVIESKTNNLSCNGIVSNLEMLLCPMIRDRIYKMPKSIKNSMEEIRLRVNQPLMIFVNNQDYFVTSSGEISNHAHNSHIVNKKNIENTLQLITNYSIYSVEEELKQGYITVQGGHRIGIAGKVLYDNQGIRTMKEFSSLNIRIAREKKGVAKNILKYLVSEKNGFMNTLIISPPQCGKTTLLRDIIRNISNGISNLNLGGVKVAVIDERSELAACYHGIPQNDLGIRTDVLDRCPKAQGMMMVIRAMSPQVIATDEIGREDDSQGIYEALLAGINLITTVHGDSLEDVLSKKVIGKLVQEGVFKRLIILSNKKGVGTIEKIIDGATHENLIDRPIVNKVVN